MRLCRRKQKEKETRTISFIKVWNVLNFNSSTAKVMPRFTLGQREWLLSFFANFFFFVPTSNVVVDTLSSPTALGLRFITNFNHFLRIEYFLHDKVKRRRSFCSFLPEDFLEKKKGQKKNALPRETNTYIYTSFSLVQTWEKTQIPWQNVTATQERKKPARRELSAKLRRRIARRKRKMNSKAEEKAEMQRKEEAKPTDRKKNRV